MSDVLLKLSEYWVWIEEIVGIAFWILFIVIIYFKKQYIKDSIRELKHVVWPTKKETVDFFIIVISVLLLFWIYLFILSAIFKETLFGLKDIVNKDTNITEIINSENKYNTDIISEEAKVKEKTVIETNEVPITDEK